MAPLDFSGMEISEEVNYNNKADSLKETTLRHIGKISEICCEEFTEGYWEEKPVKIGGGVAISRVYHQDTRGRFCNAVDFLVWICYPSGDPEFKTYIDKEETKNARKEKDLNKKLDYYQEIFAQINIMFERCKFFDGQTGRTERSKR